MRSLNGIVGKRLREVRTAAGWSQSRLEEQSGIPQARISRYEKAHVLPSVESLDRLAAPLGLTLSDFFRGI